MGLFFYVLFRGEACRNNCYSFEHFPQELPNHPVSAAVQTCQRVARKIVFFFIVIIISFPLLLKTQDVSIIILFVIHEFTMLQRKRESIPLQISFFND